VARGDSTRRIDEIDDAEMNEEIKRLRREATDEPPLPVKPGPWRICKYKPDDYARTWVPDERAARKYPGVGEHDEAGAAGVLWLYVHWAGGTAGDADAGVSRRRRGWGGVRGRGSVSPAPGGLLPPGSARVGARPGEGQAQVTADVGFAKLRNDPPSGRTGTSLGGRVFCEIAQQPRRPLAPAPPVGFGAGGGTTRGRTGTGRGGRGFCEIAQRPSRRGRLLPPGSVWTGFREMRNDPRVKRPSACPRIKGPGPGATPFEAHSRIMSAAPWALRQRKHAPTPGSDAHARLRRNQRWRPRPTAPPRHSAGQISVETR
jgi:hypothetical protein